MENYSYYEWAKGQLARFSAKQNSKFLREEVVLFQQIADRFEYPAPIIAQPSPTRPKNPILDHPPSVQRNG